MNLRARHWLLTTGRLKPGVSLAERKAELDVIGQRSRKAISGRERWLGDSPVPASTLDCRRRSLSAPGASGRRRARARHRLREPRESASHARHFPNPRIAVRTALGAGRSRIVRQLLSETAVLGVLGELPASSSPIGA